MPERLPWQQAFCLFCISKNISVSSPVGANLLLPHEAFKDSTVSIHLANGFPIPNLQQLLFPVYVNKNSPYLPPTHPKRSSFPSTSDTIPGTNARRCELSQEPNCAPAGAYDVTSAVRNQNRIRNHYTDVRQHCDDPIRPHCCRCGAAKAEPAELPNALKRQAPV